MIDAEKAVNAQKLKGALTASVTPVSDTGDLDEGAVRALVDYYVVSGLSGAFFPSSSGEYFTLTNAQRRRCVAAAAAQSAGRMPIIANISDGGILSAIENAHAMKDVGADFVALMPPSFHHHTQDELIVFFQRVADASPLPMIIYNHMTRLPSQIEVQTVEKLTAHPNIVAIKDTHNDAARLMTLRAKLGQHEGFTVLTGGDGMAGYGALMGMGMLNALSAVRPDLFIAIYQAGLLGDISTVTAIQQRINRLAGIFTALKGGKSSAALFSQSIKAALSLKGLCGTKAVQLGYNLDEADWVSLRAVLDGV
ncbi:4-hydroxy-tetrahydrodipicolinate synthase [Clostridia bacterium]|nr:4-hydroxy-tetrahydrodipicolinate synthase [Clostridia bacterium]